MDHVIFNWNLTYCIRVMKAFNNFVFYSIIIIADREISKSIYHGEKKENKNAVCGSCLRPTKKKKANKILLTCWQYEQYIDSILFAIAHW